MPLIIPNDDGEFELYESDTDSWVESCARVLLHGPPLSGKTTAITTFPANRYILVAPREMGASSIRDSKQQQVYQFKFPRIDDVLKYQQLWRGVQEYTEKILNGEYGDVTTFAIDGLHKLYYLIQKSQGYTVTSDPRDFAKYHEIFMNFLEPILMSTIPCVVCTCYDGVEVMEEAKAGQKAVTGVFPGLPGKMAKEIMGMFPLVFHTERYSAFSPKEGRVEKYRWQFRATEKVQGAGGHFPKEIRDAFPADIEPDWNAVVTLIKKQSQIDLNKELVHATTEKAVNPKGSSTKANSKTSANKGNHRR